jgi:hypothetical protein
MNFLFEWEAIERFLARKGRGSTQSKQAALRNPYAWSEFGVL